jgi:hypothetical protein
MPKRLRKRSSVDDYSITYEQARLIASGLHTMDLGGNETDVGTVLVLLQALAYSDNREDLLIACEEALMPWTAVVGEALDGLVDRQRKAIRQL